MRSEARSASARSIAGPQSRIGGHHRRRPLTPPRDAIDRDRLRRGIEAGIGILTPRRIGGDDVHVDRRRAVRPELDMPPQQPRFPVHGDRRRAPANPRCYVDVVEIDGPDQPAVIVSDDLAWGPLTSTLDVEHVSEVGRHAHLQIHRHRALARVSHLDLVAHPTGDPAPANHQARRRSSSDNVDETLDDHRRQWVRRGARQCFQRLPSSGQAVPRKVAAIIDDQPVGRRAEVSGSIGDHERPAIDQRQRIGTADGRDGIRFRVERRVVRRHGWSVLPVSRLVWRSP